MHTIYFNQTIRWGKATEVNAYGEPELEWKDIKGRWQDKVNLIRDKEGKEVVSMVRLFCSDPIQVGDILEFQGREWAVLSVASIVRLDGSESHREVYL